MKRSSSPYSVRSMPGHGCGSDNSPCVPRGTSSPSSSSTAAAMPGSGVPAIPGFIAWAPGKVVIMIPPVSVCHQVSTIGQLPPPTTFQYQSQALGLIGSPTEPSNRSLDRSAFSTCSTPHLMHARIAVGAV